MVRKSTRFLAPLAIAAVAVGAYLIIHANLSTTHSTTTQSSSAVVRHAAHRPARPKPHFYKVRSGDTLSAIASRTGVPLAQLTALNPKLSPPFNLQAGQRLRLRR